FDHQDTSMDLQTRESMEDLKSERIYKISQYNEELYMVYIKLGNYRAVEKRTVIQFISCYKNKKKTIETLNRQVMREDKPVFKKEETKQMASPQIKLAL